MRADSAISRSVANGTASLTTHAASIMTTPAPIKVLHLEDNDLDADFVQAKLEKSGLAFQIDRAANRKDFVRKLQETGYDLILSDYRVPTFEGFAALELALQYQETTPFIFVSGAMGEELAVETLKRGATDYVLKDRLVRLGSAVQRALDGAKERRGREAAERDKRRIDARYRVLFESMTQGYCVLDLDVDPKTSAVRGYRILEGNPAFRNHRALASLQADCESPPSDPAEAAWLDQIGRVSILATPIRMTVPRRVSGLETDWFDIHAFPLGEPQSRKVAVLFTDITARKQAEDRLERMLDEAKRHAALLERVAQVSRSINAVLSVEGIARILNEEGCAILQASQAVTSVSISGSPPKVFRHVSRSGVSRDGLSNEETTPSPVLAGPGSPTDWRLVVPLVGHGGRALGRVRLSIKEGGFNAEDKAVLTQLAAIASAGIENAWLYEQAREQDQHKNEFLAALAHELRNPLAPLRTGLSVVQNALTVDELVYARAMMERQVRHMVRLIDDLLDISRITRGKVALKRERVDIKSIVDAALEVSLPHLEAGGHRLEVAIGDAPMVLNVDPTRIAQVTSNLLNNAAKYTPDGGRIGLSARAEGSEAVIEVADNGVGIEPEMLQKVFEMFTQVGRTIDRAQGGLGIGLALAARLVSMHDGTISAESDGLGNGSKFVVRLPLAEPAKVDGTPLDGHAATLADGKGSSAKKRPIDKPLKVLVVDDNRDGADFLAMLIRLGGHETKTAYDGQSAIAAAREFQPKVAFLDIGLPELNGYEVAKRIRLELGNEAPFLVAVTGWGSEDDRKKSRSAGFDRHLVKPVDPALIESILDELAED